MESEESRIQNAGLTNRNRMKAVSPWIRVLANPKSNTYQEEATYLRQVKQESLTNYPVRAVITHDYYPIKEGNDMASGVSER